MGLVDVETIHTAHRFAQLCNLARFEAVCLGEHYRAGHIDKRAFNEITLLEDAALTADQHWETLTRRGATDDTMLELEDIIADEIDRLVTAVHPWREFLDELHHITRGIR